MKPVLVSGTSMWPVLKTGDLVFVDDLSPISRGDLVIRNIDGQIVLHRYLGAGLTKGDRFTTADPAGETPSARVLRVVLHRHAQPAGQRRSANVDGLILNRLNRLQSDLSTLHLSAAQGGRAIQGLITLALIANGFLIRSIYRGTQEGRTDVASQRV